MNGPSSRGERVLGDFRVRPAIIIIIIIILLLVLVLVLVIWVGIV